MREGSPPDTPESYPMRALVVALLFAAIVRGGVLIARFNNLEADPDGYRAVAENLIRVGVYGRRTESAIVPTAYRPPLYPLVLAGISHGGQIADLMIACLHFILGMTTVLLAFRLACDAGQQRFASLAAVCVALDPILLNQSTLVMTETLATFLAALSLSTLNRWWIQPRAASAILVGVVLSLAVLCRPVFLVYAVLVLPLLCYQSRRRGDWFQPIFVVLSVAIGVAPWAVRNQVVLGRPVTTTTHGGYTLLLGNNPLFYDYLRHGKTSVWDAHEFNQAWLAEVVGRDEIEQDAVAYHLATENMKRDPAMAAWSSARRLLHLWNTVPRKTQSPERTVVGLMRYSVSVWYSGIWLLVAWTVWRWRHRLLEPPLVWGVAMLIAFTLVHAFFWTNLRMRAPLMPFLYVLAAKGVGSLFGRGSNCSDEPSGSSL